MLRSKGNKKRGHASENVQGYLFIFPQVIGIMLFSVIPVVFSLYLSFTDWDFISGFKNINLIGIKNYVDMWSDVAFTDSLKNTLIFSISTVALQIGLGVVIAVIINRYVFASQYFKVAFFIPYISSLVALSIVFKAMLQPTYGPVNQFLRAIGMENPPGWFGDYKWSLAAVILLTAWRELGYYVIVFIAGLKGVPEELYEAASIDGASEIQNFRYITWPSIAPTTFFLTTMGIIGSFKAFDQIAITTQGGPGTSSSVLVYYMYTSAFKYFKMGYASSMAWVLFVVIFAVTLIQWRCQKERG
ncbi:carbohydrate ABC transporter permease [Lacrimispora brassicae]